MYCIPIPDYYEKNESVFSNYSLAPTAYVRLTTLRMRWMIEIRVVTLCRFYYLVFRIFGRPRNFTDSSARRRCDDEAKNEIEAKSSSHRTIANRMEASLRRKIWYVVFHRVLCVQALPWYNEINLHAPS